MNLAGRFLPRTEFQSHEDFRDHFRLVAPDDFNFAYDVVDVYAREAPGKRALVWCDDHGHHLSLTFADLSDLSQRAARALAALGIRKGDKVLLILKGHYHFWTILLALHRLGAVAVPASHLLSCRDLVYRVESAAVKMVICRDDGQLIPELDQAQAEVSHHFALKVSVGGEVNGCTPSTGSSPRRSRSFPVRRGRRPSAPRTWPCSIFLPGPPVCPRWSPSARPTPWGIS